MNVLHHALDGCLTDGVVSPRKFAKKPSFAIGPQPICEALDLLLCYGSVDACAVGSGVIKVEILMYLEDEVL